MLSAVEVKVNAYHMMPLCKSMPKKKRELICLVEISEGFQDVLGTQIYRTLHVLLNDIVLIITWIRSYFY